MTASDDDLLAEADRVIVGPRASMADWSHANPVVIRGHIAGLESLVSRLAAEVRALQDERDEIRGLSLERHAEIVRLTEENAAVVRNLHAAVARLADVAFALRGVMEPARELMAVAYDDGPEEEALMAALVRARDALAGAGPAVDWQSICDGVGGELAWALDLLGEFGVANDAAERALAAYREAKGQG